MVEISRSIRGRTREDVLGWLKEWQGCELDVNRRKSPDARASVEGPRRQRRQSLPQSSASQKSDGDP